MNKYKQIAKLRAVHLMAFAILTYVGLEVSIGGTSEYLRPRPPPRSVLSHRLDRDVHRQRAPWGL